MYEHHVEVIERSLARAIERQGIDTIAAGLFRRFFERFPETRHTFFGNTNIDYFGARKFRIIADFLIDTLKHPVYAEGTVCSEVMRHQMYGLKDKEYYFGLVDSLLECVREALGEEWTPEVNECWHDAASGLKGIIFEAASEYLGQ